MIRFTIRLACVAVLPLLATCGKDGPAEGLPDDATTGSVAATPLDSILGAGQEAYWDGAFDRATEIWTVGLDRARARGDREKEAVLLTSLGLAAWRLGEPDRALEQGEAALALKLELGLDSLLFRSHNALGLLAWHEGRLDEAVERFEAASDAARAVGDEESLAKATNNLGLVHTEYGEFERAREGFLQTLEASRAIGNRTIEATALSNLGMLDVRIGDPRAAVPRLREARRLFRLVDDVFYEQNTLGQLGSAYLELGDPGRALAVLDTALQRSRETGLRQEEASNLELIAEVYRTAGDAQRALAHYERAQVLNEALGLEVERGANLRSLADVFASLGDRERAAELANRALEIHSEVGAGYETLKDLLFLAEMAAQADETRRGYEWLSRARDQARRLSAHSASADVALAEARIAVRDRAFQRALRVLRDARDDLAPGSYAAQAEAEHLRARAFAGTGAVDSAAQAGRRAIDHVERIRGGYASPELRTSFLARRGSVYADHVEVLLGRGEVEEAFEVADRARGRALVEHLGTSGGASNRPLANTEALLRKIGSLVQRIEEIESIPPDERSDADERTARFLARELAEARSRYASLLVTTAESGPRTASLLSGGAVRAPAIQAALGTGEAMIAYLVTPTRLRIFVVTRSEIRSLEHEIAAGDLASRVRLARDLVSRPGNARNPPAVLSALHDVLVGPAIRSGALHGVHRLIVLPHGVLAYLPFAALVNPVSGRYVVQDYEVAVLPSASTLPVLRDPELAGPRRTTPREASVFVPLPERLPATAEEARAVERAIRGVRRFEGRRATEAAMLRSLEDSAIVHVATHGVMNPRNPLFSRLEMAPDDGEDGRLEVHELLGARIGSRLVFLSGCETGTGGAWSTEFERGEDYATLSKALLYAGARFVVATLWRIEDRGAAAFAERFYAHLPGGSPVAALARAQRDLLRDPRYRDPYYWAAYAISGAD